jgi:hypothetical protein
MPHQLIRVKINKKLHVTLLIIYGKQSISINESIIGNFGDVSEEDTLKIIGRVSKIIKSKNSYINKTMIS